MQESVFNKGHGVAAFNSAFASNTTPTQGFNTAFDQAFGPTGGGGGAFNRKTSYNNASPFGQPTQTFNQQHQSPFGHHNKSPFSQTGNDQNHASPFPFQTPKASPFQANHTSPFSTPNPQASPFQTPFNGAFKTSNNSSPFNNTPNLQAGPFQTPKANPFQTSQARPFQQNASSLQKPTVSPFQTHHQPNPLASPFTPQQQTVEHTSPFKPQQPAVEHTSPFKTSGHGGNTVFNAPKSIPFKPSLSNNRSSDSSPFKATQDSPFKAPYPIEKSQFKKPFPLAEALTSAPEQTGVRGRVAGAMSVGRGSARGGGRASVRGMSTPYLRKKPGRAAAEQDKKDTMKSAPPVKEVGKMTAEDRAMRFGSTSKSILYDQFKERRVRERQQAIEKGMIPDPENPTRLEDAIDFRGTCQTKCPEFEMLEREIQNGLDSLEMDNAGNLDPQRAVKAYRRSAAGIDQPLPSDVRSPDALLHTLDYLVDEVLSNNSLEKCHAFVRDRTRSIRQDFTLQNIRDIHAVQAHERIARFHILCLHEMCEMDEGKFSKQQETEQLRKVLVSLMEFYDDLREEGIETENEAEFRAYNIISLIRDQDVARQAMTLPINLFRSQPIQRALEFRALSQRNNEIMESSSRRNKPENIEASQNFYSAFFKLIADPDTSFLMACMLETHFPEVRKGALKAMNVSYMLKAGGVQAEDVRQVLAYDSVKQLFQEAVLYGIIINNSLGEPTLCFGQKHYNTKVSVFLEPLSNPPQTKSMLLVEPKKGDRSFSDIINGVHDEKSPVVNQNVFARQPNPFSQHPQDKETKPAQNKSMPTVMNVKLSELTGEDEKKRELETARARAAAATAQAARERELLKVMERNKQIEEEQKRQLRLQQEKAMKAKQLQEEIEQEEERIRMKELEIRKKLMEKHRQDVLRKQQKEKEMAVMHFNVVKSQIAKRILNTILGEVIDEEIEIAATKAIRTRQVLKKIGKPWLSRARAAIKKRHDQSLLRKKEWRFNMIFVTKNPYIPSHDTIYKATPKHATSEGIMKRVNQSLQAETIALKTMDPSLTEQSIWKKEDFLLNIYPRIRDKMMDLKQFRQANNNTTKPAWQLMIDVNDSETASSNWFKKKFGLDENSLRKDGFYQTFDVLTRMNTPEKEISCRSADETGAVIFSLPESDVNKTVAESAQYWEQTRNRLDKLSHTMLEYNPGMQIPFLFTYFPGTDSITAEILKKIPVLLNLQSNRLVSDYHILIMNPQTIGTRIVEEVNWLSNNTKIHQE
ncbi:hypothetical protein INT47_008561 [Mucor saturninus]|uniref:SAC3/GANP/THP3 conserved domain-containing protein n=1 Tax=Mucor saturninus TaxID=64648 RepID=A0A8H7V9V6_9FUNG|nr:hypothetical protein INT47_008561 [Mucor saturninus]